jgi:formate dehydrogenase subunit gamma
VTDVVWVKRFDLITRLVHWATAVLLLVLVLTGSILYVPQLSAAIGRRSTMNTIHVIAGLALLVPLVLGVLAGRAGRRLRRDLVELGRWDETDTAWFRRRADRPVPAGKFNGGQKLVTALFGGGMAVQLLTGAIMHWNKPFPDDWRTGATFVHDWAYVVLVVLTIGHVLKAFEEPEPRLAMLHGSVPEAWAERARPGWAARQSAANLVSSGANSARSGPTSPPAGSVQALDGGVDGDVEQDREGAGQ